MATTDLQAREELVRKMADEIWGVDGSPDAVEKYFTKDVVDYEPGETIRGLDAYKASEEELRTAMPDLDGDLEFVICQDDLVCTRYTARGTHTGEIWGIPPTEKSVEMTGNVVFRFNDDNKVVETWHEFDKFGLFAQLGLLPDELTQ